MTGALTFLAATRLVLNTGYRFDLSVPAGHCPGSRHSPHPGRFAGLGAVGTGLATPAAVRVLGRGERRHRLIVAGLTMFAVGAAITAATGVFAGALVGFILLGLGKPVFDVAAQAYLSDRTPYPCGPAIWASSN